MLELAGSLKTALKEAGIDFVTPIDPALSAGVCVIRIPAAKREAIYNQLYTEHGIAGASTGGLRLCPHIYNTREHIERAVHGIKSLIAQNK